MDVLYESFLQSPWDAISAIATFFATATAIWMVVDERSKKLNTYLFWENVTRYALILKLFNTGTRPVILSNVKMCINGICVYNQNLLESRLEGNESYLCVLPYQSLSFEINANDLKCDRNVEYNVREKVIIKLVVTDVHGRKFETKQIISQAKLAELFAGNGLFEDIRKDKSNE